MRLKLLWILITIFMLSGNAFAIMDEQKDFQKPVLRGEYNLSVKKGSFFKAILQETISTETNLQYDTIRAIIPTNFYVFNSVVVPKSSIFEGEISKLQLPKKGRHGLFEVTFDKIITPQGERIPIKASLWVNGKAQVGGQPSELGEIKVVPQRVQGLSHIGYLSVRKTGEYLKGKDVSILAGAEILIKLDEKLNIKL